MTFTGAAPHVGFVAGRYRNGAFSDRWTDVMRCADRTFTGYAPACTCGWRGPLFPASDGGHLGCRRVLAHDHLAYAATTPPVVLRPHVGGLATA